MFGKEARTIIQQDGKAQCKAACKTLFAEKQSTYLPHPEDAG